ncbi:MAG: efflux RND transporter periplasmic adaptor subunit [Lysobacter sp.]
MRIPTGLGAACALAIALTLAACGDDAPARDGARALAVTTQPVRMQPWSDTVRALGTVKARESVTLTAKVSETVEGVHFDSGDVVEAGAPLVTLSGRQQRAGLAEAQAAANEAQKLHQRLANLGEQQLIARAALDTQRATRDAANARVAQIRAQLSDRVIRAPFSGVLGLRQVSPGALVTPGTAIATLDDTSRVYVDFPVPEAALSHLAAGQRLTATSTAYPEREFAGTVATVDSRVDPATRAVTVRGEFANPDRALRPGMLMQVTLIRPERQALLVPEIAVVQVGNSSFVYRVRADDTVERADIQIGSRRNGMAEVLSGLEVGDRIVVDGTGKLRPGEKVRATAEAATRPGDPGPGETAAEVEPATTEQAQRPD